MMRRWRRGLVLAAVAAAAVVGGAVLATQPWSDSEETVEEAAAGMREYRLCDVVLEAPPRVMPQPGQERLSVLQKVGIEAYEPTVELVPTFELQIRGAVGSEVLIDPTTGAVSMEYYGKPSHRAWLQPILDTVRVEPFDPATAPWPYSDASQEPAKRAKHGIFEYRLPDPASGLVAGLMSGPTWDPVTKTGGTSEAFYLANCRSVEYIGFDPFTLEEGWGMRDVHPDDAAAFNTFLDELEVGEQGQ